jgi:RNA polymerase sigma factor (TIGR02999 family)
MAEITRLFSQALGGDRQAQDELYRLTEAELRKLAWHWIRRKSAKGRIRTTEVIDRAFIKLMRVHAPGWEHRGHFYAFACRNIMCVLIDLLREQAVPPPEDELSDGEAPSSALTAHSLMTLQEALNDLERDLSETHRAIVELRFLGECTLDEIAELLAISRDKVHRKSNVALLYLRKKLAPTFPDLVTAEHAKGDRPCAT